LKVKPLFRLAAGALGLAAPLVFAATRIGPTLDESHRRVRQVTRFGQEDYKAALGRYRGATYVAAIERIKETIPESEAYFVVEGVADGNDSYFARFDLAPRPSVWLGRINETPAIALAKLRNLEPEVKWVVVARLPDPGPEVLSREEYIRHVESQQ
jgi:hypothetical protein